MEEGLTKVKDLFRTHNYSECFEAIKELETQKGLTKAQKDFLANLKVSTYIGMRKFTAAYKVFDEAIETYSQEENWEFVAKHYVFKVRVLFNEGNKESALKLIEEGIKLIAGFEEITPSLKEEKGKLLYLKGHILFFSGNKKIAEKSLLDALEFAEENNLPDIKYHSNHWLAVIYSLNGDYDRSIPLLEDVYDYFKDNEDEFFTIARVVHNLGIAYAEIGEYKKYRDCFLLKAQLMEPTPHDIAAIGDSYWREGEIDKGIEEMKRGLEKIRSKFKEGEKHHAFQFIQANLYLRLGEHDKALEFYNRLLAKGGGYPGYRKCFCLLGVANIYIHKGEPEKALEYAQKALETAKKVGTKYGIGYGHYILGMVYYEKGEKEKALQHLQLSLDMRLAMGNKNDIALTLRELVFILSDNDESAEVTRYVTIFEQIASKTDSRVVRHNYLLSQGLILKSKGRPKYWTKAIDIFEEIVSERISGYNTLLVALVNLCELLINEFSISGVQEVLDDLQTHTSRLLDIAQKQNSYTLRVQAYHIRIITLWLVAQHSKVDINIQSAQKLLQEAYELAESHGLVRLALKINNQNKKLLEDLESWDEFIRKYYEFIRTS